MKKNFILGLLAIIMMFAASCEQQELTPNLGSEATVSFNVATPQIATKAYSDGTTATKLQYAVYDAEGNILGDLTKTNETINGSATVKLPLVTGNTYSVIFWAAAPNAPYAVDLENKKMTVDYTKATCNDEARDAFYAYHTFTVTGAQTETIELKRPFAQLNIGTNDYIASENAGYVPTKSSVTVKQVYSTLDLVEGKVSDDVAVTFDSAAIPDGETFPVTGYDYLAMNYLLVAKDKEVVDIEFTYTDGSNAKTRTVGSVPVQRNYRTNIYGALLTSEVDINVEIKPEYDGANNNEHLYYKEEGIYYIQSADGLRYFAEQVNAGNAEWLTANVALAQDIDLSATTRAASNWTPIGSSTDLGNGKTFTGSFDGQGHAIKNMVCEGAEVAGLFGYLYAATIKNVTIEDATIKSNHFAGGIVAWVNNYKGNIQKPFVIENCHIVNSTITSTPEEVNDAWDNGDKVGGLIGAAWFNQGSGLNVGTKIANSSVSNTTIKAYRDFGGLVGYAKGVNVENCTADVTLEQDLSHDYKDPTPETFSTTFGNDAGLNTVDGLPYLADGVTTENEENYHIYNAAGLKWLADEVNRYSNYEYPFQGKVIYLTQNIDLNGMEWTPIGDYRFSANRFCGTFDGQNHTISNFKITKKTDKNDSNKSSYGFFGNVEGVVKNLTVANTTVSSYAYTGALVGRLNSGLIDNCHVVECAVSNTYWQGGILIGQVNGGSVKNCTVKKSSITSKSAIGAISGPVTNESDDDIVFENCLVDNCQVIQAGSFGGSYDKYFGTMFGYLEAGNGKNIRVNNCTAINTTVKGESNAMFAGDIDGNIYVNECLTIATADALKAAIVAGGNYILLNDVAMTEASYQNVNFTLDGNGYTISQAEGSTNSYALFDSVTGKISFKNVKFAGIKGGAVLRTIGAEVTLDNVTIEGAETTQQQGLLRLVGKSTIKNSTFKNNTCSMVITLNYDAANNDPQVVEGCVFEGNTCNGTAVLYYVKGASATINANKFIGNTVNCTNNGATIYMGFTENNVITNNLFMNNTVNEATESSRVAGGVFFGYETVFTGNAFIGNKVTGTKVKGNDVCVSTYYTSIDLSGNYWGGGAPVEDVNYFVQHKSDERVVIINDYLTENPIQ